MDTMPATTPLPTNEMPMSPPPKDNRKAIALVIFLIVYLIGMSIITARVLMQRNALQTVKPTNGLPQEESPTPMPSPICPEEAVARSFEETNGKPTQICALYLSPRTERSEPFEGEVVQDEPRTGSAIGSLPMDIGAMKNLKVLQANRNDLISVPSTLDQLQSLTHVSLSTNNFRVIPEDILSLTNLVALDMSRNMITDVPVGVGALSHLEHLVLYGNRISILPEEIGDLRSLTLLQLSENRITRLPETITNLTNLQDLYLSGNPLVAGELNRIKSLLPETNVHF